MSEYYIGYVGEYFEVIIETPENEDILLCLNEGSTLPKGVLLNVKNKKIEGYPSEVYRQTITIYQKNNNTGEEYYENVLILIKEAREFTLLTKEITDITAGVDYSFYFECLGGVGDIEYSSDTLPDGLILSKEGHLHGNVKIGGGSFPLFINIKDQTNKQLRKEFHVRIHRRNT